MSESDWNKQVRETQEQQKKATQIALDNINKLQGQELSLNDLADQTVSRNPTSGKGKRRTQADRVDYVKEAKRRVRLLHAANIISDCEKSVIDFLLDSTVAQQTDIIRTSKQGIAKYIDFDRSSVSKCLKRLNNNGVISLGNTLGRKLRPQEIKLNNFEIWFRNSR